MTSRKPLLLITAASLFLTASASLLAQDQLTPVPPAPASQVPPPPGNPASPPPPPPPPPPPSSSPADGDGVSHQAPQGEVVVRSSVAPAVAAGPAPAFAELAGKTGSISPAKATSYPPLANDFGYADRNHDGRISKAEYQAWLKHN